jgi:hypothetical protein
MATARAVVNPPVKQTLGGREYSMFSAPKCFVCQSPMRLDIERCIIQGYGYGAIVQRIRPHLVLGEVRTFTARHLRNHMKQGHMPLREMAKRAAYDLRMEEMGEDLESAMGRCSDNVTLFREIVAQGYEDLVEGRMDLSAGDVMRAASALAKVETGSDNIDLLEVQQAFGIFGQIVTSIFGMIEAGELRPEDASKQLGTMVSTNVTLAQLNERWYAKQAEAAGLAEAS